MKTFLIIASAAKNGGALTIINKFIEWAGTKKYKFVVVAPKIFVPIKTNIFHIEIKTSNILSPFFTLFCSLFFIIKYKPDISISFNNLPILFSFFFKTKSYTYFHNLDLATENNFKSIIYRFLIKNFSDEIIVQTPYTKKIIKSFFKKKINLIWPGILYYKNKKKNFDERKIFMTNSKIFLYPVSDVLIKNKNFEFILKFSKFFISNAIKIVIPCNPPEFLPKNSNEFLIFMGNVEHQEMMQIYKKCYATLFLSFQESYGLPIYESLFNSKPVFVLKKDYIKYNLNYFKKDPLLILFSENKFEKTLLNYLRQNNLKKNKINAKLSKQYLYDNWSVLLK